MAFNVSFSLAPLTTGSTSTYKKEKVNIRSFSKQQTVLSFLALTSRLYLARFASASRTLSTSSAVPLSLNRAWLCLGVEHEERCVGHHCSATSAVGYSLLRAYCGGFKSRDFSRTRLTLRRHPSPLSRLLRKLYIDY